MVERRRPSSGGLCHCALTCCHATSQDILWELGECGVGRGVSLGGGVQCRCRKGALRGEERCGVGEVIGRRCGKGVLGGGEVWCGGLGEVIGRRCGKGVLGGEGHIV